MYIYTEWSCREHPIPICQQAFQIDLHVIWLSYYTTEFITLSCMAIYYSLGPVHSIVKKSAIAKRGNVLDVCSCPSWLVTISKLSEGFECQQPQVAKSHMDTLGGIGGGKETTLEKD
jgi:hypothetical protein